MSRIICISFVNFILQVLILLVFKQNLVNCTKNDIGAIAYLQRYGYMNESMGSANLISESSFKEAIKIFQRFVGLNETGKLDQNTVRMMSQPRCGNKDRTGHAEEARRRRYALQGSKWRRTDLTYRISKYPKKMKRSIVDKEIARAFELWSNVTPLNFIPKSEGKVHIDIKFVVGDHSDGDPFDGPGLGHSSVRESLMAPFYQRYRPNFELHKDDILGIQALYGESSSNNSPYSTTYATTTTTTERSISPSAKPLDEDEKTEANNELCSRGSIDAITRTVSGRTFVFKGDYYWHIETTGVAEGYPRKISEDWGGLPGNLDAALTWADGKTFFFKGDKYWRFFDMKMSSGYPKDISVGFAGIPNNVDLAFTWSGNGKTYFFKGNQYWRFDSKSDPPVSSRYPKPIKNWVGLPSQSLDAAFKWENGLTYFFKGTEYYRFNDADFEVDRRAKPSFPRPISVWWFDCPKSKSQDLLYSNRRKPVSLTQLTRFRNKPKFDLDGLSSSPIESSYHPPSYSSPYSPSHLTSSLLTAVEKDWISIGHPDQDQPGIAAAYSMSQPLYSSSSKLINSSFLAFISIVANLSYLFIRFN